MHKILRNQLISKSTLNTLLTLFITLLPFNVGKIVSDKIAHFGGIHINYLQIRINLIDLVALIIVTLFVLKNTKESRKIGKYMVLIPLTLLLPSLIFLFNEHSFTLKLLRVLLFAISFTIKLTALLIFLRQFISEESTKFKKQLLYGIYFSSTVQLILSILQIVLKSPIPFRLLTILGQPPRFTSFFYLNLEQIPRAYGTTAHPNILGGVVGFYLILLFSLRSNKQNDYKLTKLPLYLILTTTLFLTISKSAILGVVAVAIFILLQKSLKITINFKKYSIIIPLVISMSSVLLLFLTNAICKHIYFVEMRILILRMYSEIITLKQIFAGSGVLSSVPNLLKSQTMLKTSLLYNSSLLIEPIHNSFLLAIYEIGVMPFLILLFQIQRLFSTLLTQSKQEANIFLISILIFAGVVAGFDHYLWY